MSEPLPVVGEKERAERCETCRFWDGERVEEESASQGQCHRYPPHLVQVSVLRRAKDNNTDDLDADKAWQWEFPTLFFDGWCGEWRAVPAPMPLPDEVKEICRQLDADKETVKQFWHPK